MTITAFCYFAFFIIFFAGTQASDTIHVVRITEIEVRVESDLWSSWKTPTFMMFGINVYYF